MRTLNNKEIQLVGAGCLGLDGLNPRERGMIWLLSATSALAVSCIGGIASAISLCNRSTKLDDDTCSSIKTAIGAGFGFGAIAGVGLFALAAKIIRSDKNPGTTIMVSRV